MKALDEFRLQFHFNFTCTFTGNLNKSGVDEFIIDEHEMNLMLHAFSHIIEHN